MSLEAVNKILSSKSKNLFKEIVGNEVDELLYHMGQQGTGFVNAVFSSTKRTKFIENDFLNKKGMHILRCLLSKELTDHNRNMTGLSQDPNFQSFNKNGYLKLENFLDEEEFEFLRSQIVNPSFKKSSPHDAIKYKISENKKFQNIISMANGFHITYPHFDSYDYIMVHEPHKTKDLHIDIFFPTIKFWLYLEDIDISKGPLHYVPGSHDDTKENKLRWLYETSLVASQPSHPLHKKRKFTHKDNAFRLCIGGDNKTELNSLGFNMEIPMVGKKNTLVIIDVNGFHRRGDAADGTIRRSIRGFVREDPFKLANEELMCYINGRS